MRLNLYQILERLEVAFTVLTIRNEADAETIPDDFPISQVRLYSPILENPRTDALYIARYQDLAGAETKSGNPKDVLSRITLTPPSVHLLICGAPAEALAAGYIDSGSAPASLLSLSLLGTDEADLLWVLDRIQDILALYQDWETQVQTGIWENIPVQETFDRCAGILGRPAGIFDLQQNLLMKTGFTDEMPETDRLDALWRFTLEHGFTPHEGGRAEDFNRLFRRSRKPFQYVSDDSFREACRIIAPLYLNGAVFACLGMHLIGRTPTPGETADFTLVQKYLNRAFSHTDEFHYSGKKTPWFIVQLLQGRQSDRMILKTNFQRLGVDMDRHFILWNFKCMSGTPTEKLLPVISLHFHSDLIFDYNGSILVMDLQTADHDKEVFAKTLKNLLMQHDLICGRSMIFQSPALLHEACLQTEIALLGSSRQGVNAYIDCYQNYIRKCISGQAEKNGLLYPGIQLLLTEEAEYGRDLLRCLKSYVLMGRNASRTAKELFIHRHTVLYRLEKIESLLQISLEQLGEKELALLYISCLMLLEE